MHTLRIRCQNSIHDLEISALLTFSEEFTNEVVCIEEASGVSVGRLARTIEEYSASENQDAATNVVKT